MLEPSERLPQEFVSLWGINEENIFFRGVLHALKTFK